MSPNRRGTVNHGLRRFDHWGPDGAAQERQIEKPCRRDAGAHRRTRAGRNSGEPAEYRGRQHRRCEPGNREPPGARPRACSGRSAGRHWLRKHGVQRTGVPAPERLGAGCRRAVLHRVLRAGAERDQLLARSEPVARKRHYVASGPRLFAAVIGCWAFRLHPVAVLLYRICRSFPPHRGGFRPLRAVVYPSELVPVRLN
jgi:hypothetical protein